MSAQTRRSARQNPKNKEKSIKYQTVAAIAALIALGASAGCGPGSSETCDPNAMTLGDWVTRSAEGSSAPQRLIVSVHDLQRVAQVRVRFQSSAPVVLLYRPQLRAYDIPSLLASPLGVPSEQEVTRLSEPMTDGEVTVQGPLDQGDLVFAVAEASAARAPLSMSAYIRADYDPAGVGKINGRLYCSLPYLRADNAACGDGQRSGAETCDDGDRDTGDRDTGDGCTACAVEPIVCGRNEPLRWYPWRCAPLTDLGPDQCAPQLCVDFADDPLCGAPRAATARAVTLGLQRGDEDAGEVRYVGARAPDGEENGGCGGVMDSALAAPQRCAWVTSPCAQAQAQGAPPLMGWGAQWEIGACTPTAAGDGCAWPDLGRAPLTAAAVFSAPETATRWQRTFSGSDPLWVADPRGGWRLIATQGATQTLDGAPLAFEDGLTDAPGLLDLSFDADGGLRRARRLLVVGVGVRPLAAAVSADGDLWLALRYGGLTTLPTGASLSAPVQGAAPLALLRLDDGGVLRALYTTDPEQSSVFDSAVLAMPPYRAGDTQGPAAVLVAASEARAAAAFLLTPSADGAALELAWRAELSAPGVLAITAAALDDVGEVFLAGASGGEPTLTTPSPQGPNGPPQVTTLEGGEDRPGGLLLALSRVDGSLGWARHFYGAERGLRAATLRWSGVRALHYLGAFDRAREGLPDAGLALATLDPASGEPLDVTFLGDLPEGCGSLVYPALMESAWVTSLNVTDADALAVARSRCGDSAAVVSALSALSALSAERTERVAVATEVMGDGALSRSVMAALSGVVEHPAQPGEVATLRANPSAEPAGEGWRVDVLSFSH